MAPSFLELVSETPDLAAGAEMFIFTLAPSSVGLDLAAPACSGTGGAHW
jgi:hypothetical protein